MDTPTISTLKPAEQRYIRALLAAEERHQQRLKEASKAKDVTLSA